jgi:ferredoxin
MATHITQECINCSACEPVCPNEAVSAGDGIYIIDAERCTECVGFQATEACQEACPVRCCPPDPDHLESEEQLYAKLATIHPDRDFPPLADLPASLSRFRN